jgi:hypothetical protein
MNIVAGASGQSGSVDGGAGVSRLSFPVSCTTAHGSVYFIEQGRVPSIKSFDGNTILTIFSGAPLKNLTDLCAGDPGTLLICDRGSSCIWKLSIANGEITPLLTVSDLCEGEEMSLPFTPSGIVKVADGSYLFSDLSRHQVFRYMSPECAQEALQASQLTYCTLEEASSSSLQDISGYIRTAQHVRGNILDGIARVWKTKEAILTHQYSLELRRYAPLLNQKVSFPKDGISVLLRNAPSFVGVEALLRNITLTPDLLLKLQESLSVFVQDYDFSSPLINTEREIQALTNIFSFSLPIAGQDLFCKILKDERSHVLRSFPLTSLSNLDLIVMSASAQCASSQLFLFRWSGPLTAQSSWIYVVKSRDG